MSAGLIRKPDHQQQTCKICKRPDKFDFTVPNDIWAAVVPAEFVGRVVCLYCFDDLADQKGIDYADHLGHFYFAGDRASISFEVEKALNC